MKRALNVFGVQHALDHLRRVRHRHHHCTANQFRESREHGIRDDGAPILPDKMHQLAAAQQPDQLGDIGGERGFVIKAVLWNFSREVPAQVRRNRPVTGVSQRGHLMVPGMRCVGKTV